MTISEPAHFSMRRSRFCPDLAGFPPSFFNPEGTKSCSKSEVWPGCPTSRVSTAFCPRGFRPACARNMVPRDFDSESSETARFSCIRTGNVMDGLPGMGGAKFVTGAAFAVLLMASVGPSPALADTIEAALVRAYQTNPQLNSQRATVRSTDENVPQALSGYRPKVAVTASAGVQYTDTLTTAGGSKDALVRTITHGVNSPRTAGLTVSQTLFNGQQTA